MSKEEAKLIIEKLVERFYKLWQEKMKNPFYFNMFWLSLVTAFFLITIFTSILCSNFGLCFSKNAESISLGILSSAILLLCTEIILFIRDKKRYSFLSGTYKRLEIYQVNKDRKQSDKSITIKEQSGEKFEYKTNSIYHRLMIYDEFIDLYKIELNYLHFGKYSGKIDYNQGKANITISLDLINETQGKGTYQYYYRDDNDLPDLGQYDIHVGQNEIQTRLYVYYKNTLQTGAAEGYEIWEKIK